MIVINWVMTTNEVKKIVIQSMPEKMVDDLKMFKQVFGARVEEVTFSDKEIENVNCSTWQHEE